VSGAVSPLRQRARLFLVVALVAQVLNNEFRYVTGSLAPLLFSAATCFFDFSYLSVSDTSLILWAGKDG
jgi:hypothetical protein